jgi:hypothetical protein
MITSVNSSVTLGGRQLPAAIAGDQDPAIFFFRPARLIMILNR